MRPGHLNRGRDLLGRLDRDVHRHLDKRAPGLKVGRNHLASVRSWISSPDRAKYHLPSSKMRRKKGKEECSPRQFPEAWRWRMESRQMRRGALSAASHVMPPRLLNRLVKRRRLRSFHTAPCWVAPSSAEAPGR
ncbi:unnamed protein product [Linum trigynum]|uniref:Uncharacterized protein n=1 Tax=Linum trigynum TaxID=586398 RepID=A0AAV2F5P4_9ROSI